MEVSEEGKEEDEKAGMRSERKTGKIKKKERQRKKRKN